MSWRDTYFKREKLGEGSFGVVYRAEWYFFTTYAVKEIKWIEKSAIQEIQILKQVNHRNIIKYVEHFYDRDADELAIVMEYAHHGTMTVYRAHRAYLEYRYHRTTSEKSTWHLLYEISDALSYLHYHKIMHRDLKPDNILCFNSNKRRPTFKLADFGIAKLLQSDEQGKFYTKSTGGTSIYMAPEVLREEKYTFSADMWSLGAIASFWYNNTHLFYEKEQVLAWNGEQSPLPETFNSEINGLVASLLNPKHRERPTAESVLKTINNGKFLGLCTIL